MSEIEKIVDNIAVKAGEYEGITLICTSLNPDDEKLSRMLASAKGFDQIVLHIDSDTKENFKLHQLPGSPLCQFVYPNHLEIPDAYNLMIHAVVTTPWVCCFCDDDFFYEEGLAQMIREVHAGVVAGVAHFKFHISGYLPSQDFRGNLIKFISGQSEYDLCEQLEVTPYLLDLHNRLPAGAFFRKSAWKLAGGFTGDFEHDRIIWKKMATAGVEFKYFPYLVYEFCRREESAWHRQRSLQNSLKFFLTLRNNMLNLSQMNKGGLHG